MHVHDIGLSQMLADEDWSEDEEVDESDVTSWLENKTMTYDEFAQKATEIIEQAESEIAETAEIMSATSFAEYDVTNREKSLSMVSPPPIRRKVMDEPAPLYDQTRLDGISQLWGAPPDVLERNMIEDDNESEQDIINEGKDFSNVYALWGEDVTSATAELDEKEESIISSRSMDGFSQLWNEKLSPYSQDGIDTEVEAGGGDRGSVDSSAYAGLEWWDEVTEDGSSFRKLLSALF